MSVKDIGFLDLLPKDLIHIINKYHEYNNLPRVVIKKGNSSFENPFLCYLSKVEHVIDVVNGCYLNIKDGDYYIDIFHDTTMFRLVEMIPNSLIKYSIYAHGILTGTIDIKNDLGLAISFDSRIDVVIPLLKNMVVPFEIQCCIYDDCNIDNLPMRFITKHLIIQIGHDETKDYLKGKFKQFVLDERNRQVDPKLLGRWYELMAKHFYRSKSRHVSKYYCDVKYIEKPIFTPIKTT